MIYNFDTENENAALAALIVYGCYKSRDKNKFKVTPDMWGIIERSVKSSAKRSRDINDFIEKFKKKVSCSTIQPRHMMSHAKSPTLLVAAADGSGDLFQKEEKGRRDFWLTIIESSDNEKIIKEIYSHTSFVIVLVRDRLEREKTLLALGMMKEEDKEDEEV